MPIAGFSSDQRYVFYSTNYYQEEGQDLMGRLVLCRAEDVWMPADWAWGGVCPRRPLGVPVRSVDSAAEKHCASFPRPALKGVNGLGGESVLVNLSPEAVVAADALDRGGDFARWRLLVRR